MDLLEVGRIVNTHGLRGEVKVVPWTDNADDLEAVATVYVHLAGEEKSLTVQNIRYQKNNLIVKFAEISSIEEAERYKGAVISAERDELGELPEGVYYIADLIGLRVEDEAGRYIGTIKDVFNTGANDIYEIERGGKKPLLLPVIEETVLEVNIAGGFVRVHILEGLEEL